MRTNIQLDFEDGMAVSHSNLSWIEEGIRHVYKTAGILCVSALAENTLGFHTTTLYLHVTSGDQLRQENLIHLHQRENEHCYGPCVFSQCHTTRQQDDSSPRVLQISAFIFLS